MPIRTKRYLLRAIIYMIRYIIINIEIQLYKTTCISRRNMFSREAESVYGGRDGDLV